MPPARGHRRQDRAAQELLKLRPDLRQRCGRQATRDREHPEPALVRFVQRAVGGGRCITLVADVVIETRPGMAVQVAERISHVQGFRLFGGDGQHLVSGLWRVPEGNTLEGMCEALQALNPEILRVYPTFVGEER